ncbi:MAG: adenylate/guanylate cyclase domain-containing protein, partial [Anaerolineae bacterium]
MKCPNCGNENPEDAQFCYRCGTSLPIEGGAPAENGAWLAEPAREPWLARLERYMPGDLLDKIRTQGRIEGEQRPVTVLFADLTGFTALGDVLEAEALKNLINESLEVLVRAVFKYEGFVDKFIGDAVMALFGAPIAHEDDPERALRAALDMVGGLESLALALPESAGSLSLHAGVHTGDVVMGEVGTDLRLSYTAIGDTVNVASRLQDLAPPGEVLVSEATYRLTQTLFTFQELAPREVKGKKARIKAFRLKAAKSGARAPRGIPGLQASLIGREAEYEALATAVRSTVQGLGQIVAVTGEPGIGKSRLVLEAQHQFGEDATWLEGRCLSYGASIAFWPFAEVVKQWAGIEEEDPEAAMAAKLRLALRGLVPDRLDDFLPYLGTLLALRLEDRDAERV